MANGGPVGKMEHDMNTGLKCLPTGMVLAPVAEVVKESSSPVSRWAMVCMGILGEYTYCGPRIYQSYIFQAMWNPIFSRSCSCSGLSGLGVQVRPRTLNPNPKT